MVGVEVLLFILQYSNTTERQTTLVYDLYTFYACLYIHIYILKLRSLLDKVSMMRV
jgi:hypothetical protein